MPRQQTTERVPFRLIHTECCGTLLCWVNPRLPSYCPECGKRCYPDVRSWVVASDNDALLKLDKNINPTFVETG